MPYPGPVTLTLNLAKSLPKPCDAVVLGLTTINDGEPALVGQLPGLEQRARKEFGHTLAELVDAMGASPSPERVTPLPIIDGMRVFVVGLGDADVAPEGIRRAAGAALRVIAENEQADRWQVALSLELNDPELVQAAAEGAALGAYRFAKLTADQVQVRVTTVTLVGAATEREQKSAIAAAGIISAAVCRARDWINTPPNRLYPEAFAEEARQWLRDERIAVEVLDEKALEKGGYGGILAVGGGSSRSPRLVRASYSPRGAKHHLVLVGKGITFDSGGLDIKPAGQMATMKYDMSGAAAILAAIKAIAGLGLRVQVTAYAALAENLPSGSSYRAGDVLTMFDGTTVENYNTDAEGRLVLADAIGRAGLDRPDLIVDVATLTGACMVALGQRMAGLITNSEETADLLLDAAESVGEEFWQLPLTEHTRSELKSSIADVRSGASHRYGGALVAGAFLERFVPEDVAWAHLDIAGPANNDGQPYGHVPTGGTGVAVRTLVALAQSLGR